MCVRPGNALLPGMAKGPATLETPSRTWVNPALGRRPPFTSPAQPEPSLAGRARDQLYRFCVVGLRGEAVDHPKESAVLRVVRADGVILMGPDDQLRPGYCRGHHHHDQGAVAMDKASAIDLARRYSELVIRHLPVKQVYLFGSYAREAAGPDSDIDIAVIVERLDGDYLDEQARLFRLRRSVDLRIEPILIEDGDRSGFLKSIRDTGYLVYPVASCRRDCR